MRLSTRRWSERDDRFGKCAACVREPLFADDFDQHSLAAHSIEFPVEDLLPWTEVEFTVGNCDDYLSSHDGALEVRVRVIFGAVVTVLRVRLFRGELFKPCLDVLMQAAFVVIDEDTRADVHGIYQAQIVYLAFPSYLLDLWGLKIAFCACAVHYRLGNLQIKRHWTTG